MGIIKKMNKIKRLISGLIMLIMLLTLFSGISIHSSAEGDHTLIDTFVEMPLPIETLMRSPIEVSIYNENGSKIIDVIKDLTVKILSIDLNGWVNIEYKVSNVTKTGYCKTEDIFFAYNRKLSMSNAVIMGADTDVYGRADLKTKQLTLKKLTFFHRLGVRYGSVQILYYDTQRGIYRLGWIKTDAKKYPCPVNTKINGNFASWKDSEGFVHDVSPLAQGTPVYAVADGVAEYRYFFIVQNNVKYYVSYGKYINYFCDDGNLLIFAHLSKFATNDFTGIPIKNTLIKSIKTVPWATDQYFASVRYKKGDIIGYSGTTGNSYGPHLHIEVFVDDVRKDPLKYFEMVVR